MTKEEWKQQRYMCDNAHTFNKNELVGTIDNYRCPICNKKARLIDIPVGYDRYLYINTDYRYYQ